MNRREVGSLRTTDDRRWSSSASSRCPCSTSPTRRSSPLLEHVGVSDDGPDRSCPEAAAEEGEHSMGFREAHHRVRRPLAAAGDLRGRVPGVIVEAFLPRERRYLTQAVLAVGGLVVALVGSVFVALDLPELKRPTATRGPRGRIGRGRHPGHRRPDGSSSGAWSWSSRSPACCCLRSAGSRAGSRRSPARLRRCPAPKPSVRRRPAAWSTPRSTRCLMFAVAGMMLFPAANDLLTMFVALEVLSLPLYLLCGLARRRRLLSQEAALKYFLLGAFSSGFFLYGVALLYGYAGSMQLAPSTRRSAPHRQPRAAADRDGHAGRRPAVQGRRRPVPRLDARRLPGRARPRSPRSWPRAPRSPRSAPCCGCSTSLRRGPLDLAADDVGHRDPHHGRRRGRCAARRPT